MNRRFLPSFLLLAMLVANAVAIVGSVKEVRAAGETLTIDAPVVFGGSYTVSSGQFIDAANSAYFLDPAATGDSLVLAGTATASGNLTVGNGNAIRSAFGPLSLQYKSGLNAWTTGLTLQDTTGNVGIGTTGPGVKLDVLANVNDIAARIQNSDVTNGYGIDITAGGSASGRYIARLRNQAGTDVFYAGANGNVGIGTTGPSSILHLQSTAPTLILSDSDEAGSLDILIQFRGNDGGVKGSIGYNNSNDLVLNNLFGNPMTFNTNNTERIRIDGTGNVGIGTTGPSYKLHVASSGGYLAYFQNTSATDYRPVGFTDENNAVVGSIGYDTTIDRFSISDTSGKVVTINSGNVGIGTTSPATNLDVAGTSGVQIRSGYGPTTITSVNYMKLGGGGTSPDAGSITWGDNSGWKLNLGTIVSSVFTPRVTFVDSGNVGIGTTGPGYKLDVSGTGRFTDQTYLTATKNLWFDTGVNAWRVQQTTAGATGKIQISQDGVRDVMTLDNNGNVGIGTTGPGSRLEVENTASADDVLLLEDSSGLCEAQPTTTGLTWSCSSDIRLKTNVRSASSVLGYIAGIPLKDYTVTKTGENATGPIAQELLAGYPELVRTGDDGYYQVSELSPWTLVKAIQELTVENETLKTRVAALEAR